MLFPFLSNHGVLGLNARNLLYIKPFNPRKAVAFADDKMKTKSFLSARGIPTAKVYARIDTREQLQSFDFSSLPDHCVLKPNYGFGGEGILILKGRRNGVFLEQGKQPITNEELVEHIEDILDGKFSVNGRMDRAFFEKILLPDDVFLPFRPAGLPDIRIVVFNLVPIMAMLRIPTAESDGKANVHLGGLGIGIDIAKGSTTHAAQYNRIITHMPHGGPVPVISIPRWEELLLTASRIQYTTNIGYLAVDLTLDDEQGPVLLEVNARAGLMVQVANLAPLRTRLERVEGLSVPTPEKGVRIAQELFGQKLRRPTSKDTTEARPILSLHETISIVGDGFRLEEACIVSPEEESTVFSRQLIDELIEHQLIEREEGNDESYKTKFSLGGRKIQTLVHVQENMPGPQRVIIGRRDVQGFLLDPGKREKKVSARSSKKVDLRAIDHALADADSELLLLKYMRPINIREERLRLVEDRRYNPLFLFREIDIDLDAMIKRLDDMRIDESPLGILLEKKRREMLLKFDVLRTRGNAQRFSEASKALYGMPTRLLTAQANAFLLTQIACDVPPPAEQLLSAQQAVPLFEEVLQKYGLHDWQIRVRENLVSDCATGGKHVYLRDGAMFSREHIAALIAHEIETHALTSENGSYQPFELFRRGFANYLETQEGLAVYNQNRVLSLHHEKRYGHARSVLAVAYALEHSFAHTRAYLQDELLYAPEKAISKTIELKRGIADTSEPGAFTKSIVYFRGLRSIEHFVQQGGNVQRLYIGKVALEDLALAELVPGLKQPLLIPMFLQPHAQPSTTNTGPTASSDSQMQKDDGIE